MKFGLYRRAIRRRNWQAGGNQFLGIALPAALGRSQQVFRGANFERRRTHSAPPGGFPLLIALM
jgi:hypothetical protein